jgi:hypothetical protein
MVLKFKYNSENIYLLVASRLFIHRNTSQFLSHQPIVEQETKQSIRSHTEIL